MLSSAPPFDRPDVAGAGVPAHSSTPNVAPSPWSLMATALRRAVIGVGGGGGVAQAGGLLNTLPTTSMGAADADTEQAAWRSNRRDHSDAAVASRRLEEAQADQAEAEANARARALSGRQQQQRARRLAHRHSQSQSQSQGHSRANANDGPRFHIDQHSDEEEAEGADLPPRAVGHVPAAAAGSAAAQGQEEHPRAWLDRIKDPEIRDVLDPDSSSYVNPSILMTWSDDKLMELVNNVDPERVEALLIKQRRGQLQAEGANVAPEDFTTTLSWRNLYYSLNGTVLLQNVSGYVKPGMLVAVLGGPDAGITTLLDILAQRAPVGGSGGGQLLGEIYVNRRAPDATFGRRVGYVKKDDVHLPQLTVAETLYFSARLRNPHMSRRVAFVRVALIMKLLGLLHTWATPIGDDIVRGISGGEKRRVSFGLELVAGLQTLIADLPTNGLDATSALSLLHVYKSMTRIGRAMICSLVQPSPYIFALLDMVIVLSKGAQLYFGPPDLAIRHFESLGFERPAAKSVPQFLEELSAAPEKFVSMRLTGRDRLLPQRPQRRPLALLREREKRFKQCRRRLLLTRGFLESDAASSSALDGVVHCDSESEPEDECLLSGSSNGSAAAILPPVHQVVIEMGAIHQTAAGKHHRATRHREDDALPIDGALSFSPPRADVAPSASPAPAPTRYEAWHTLLQGYQSSVFEADVGYVLHNELTPLPHFHRVHGRAAAAKRKATAAKARSAAGAAVGPAASLPTFTHSDSSRPSRDKYQTTFWVQYVENVIRFRVLFGRNRALWLLNFVKSVVIGLLIGTLFWQISLAQNNVRTRFGLAYFMLIFNVANAQQLVPVFLSFRRVFQLQKEGRYYSPLSYHLALLTINVPIAVLETLLFIVVVYPMSGLHGGLGSTQFGFMYLILLLVNLVSRSWVTLLTSVTPTEALTNILNGISLIVFSIFSGYLNPRDSIPPGWIWAHYISYFTWTLRGLMINEQTGLVYDCNPNSPIPCQYPTGEAALRLFGMDGGEGEKWLCVLWLCLFLVGFVGGAALAMTYVDLVPQDREEEPDFEQDDQVAAKEIKRTASASAITLGDATRVELITSDSNSSTTTTARALDQSSADAAANADSAHAKHSSGGFISWNNLSYSVSVGGTEKERTLLHDMFGYAKPGMMVALMGASGSGKTTLLDVLAGKKTGGKISGNLMVNGLPVDESFMRIVGYAEQTDAHHERSTVREAVRFSAMLRLPASVTDDPAEVDRRVDHVLAQLGLTRLQHDLIGNTSTGGISQAARKKVTIAVEMIGEPRILFLDEPTTGLDSAGALDVLDCISLLSASMAVLCTVHQPSQELMERFNYLCLLQSGGRTVYFGELSRMAEYFPTVGLPPHHEGDNLADYAIRCVKVVGGAGALLQADGQPVDLSRAFRQSAEGRQVLHDIEAGVAPALVAEAWTGELEQLRLSSHQGALAPFSLQFRLLFGRFSWGLLRSPDLVGGRIAAQLVMSFIIGTCFFQLSDSQRGAQNRVACLFLTVQFVMGSGALKLPAIFSERSVVFRERQSRMYSVEAYYLARWLHDAWLWAVENFVFLIMVYFICNLNAADGYARLGVFYLLLLLTAQVGFSLSELVGLMSGRPATAYALQGAVTAVSSLLSGFLIAKSNMPVGWAWANNVSPNRYPLAASIQNEMRGQEFTCAAAQQFMAPAPLCGRMAPSLRCPVACGEELLTAMGVPITAADEAQNIGIMAVYIVGFKLLGYLAFKYMNHIKR